MAFFFIYASLVTITGFGVPNYEVKQRANFYVVVNTTLNREVPGGAHATKEDADQHIQGLKAGMLAQVVGAKIAMMFNVLYLMAGLAMFFGLGLMRGNLEAFGLILVPPSLIIRVIATGWVQGFTLNPAIINGYVLNAAFIFACVVRLMVLLRAQRVLVANGVT